MNARPIYVSLGEEEEGQKVEALKGSMMQIEGLAR
jgi:hypothetical protein